MNKADIAATIAARTGFSAKEGKEALETVLKAIKHALKEDRSIDLGQLGRLRTVRLSRRRRITRGLKNVGTSISAYSKHAKTVKLKSKLDLSKDPLPTIVHPVPAKPRYIKRPCAIAYPTWRRHIARGLTGHRGPSTHFSGNRVNQDLVHLFTFKGSGLYPLRDRSAFGLVLGGLR
jgi:nucleoid DNA-binding protein